MEFGHVGQMEFGHVGQMEFAHFIDCFVTVAEVLESWDSIFPWPFETG